MYTNLAMNAAVRNAALKPNTGHLKMIMGTKTFTTAALHVNTLGGQMGLILKWRLI